MTLRTASRGILSKRVCGLDEAGRGAWAGPLVAAGVIVPRGFWRVVAKGKLPIRDGKCLTRRQREKWEKILMNQGGEVTVEVISVLQINNRGIAWANREIFRRLIRKIEAEEYLVDGNLKVGRLKGKEGKVKTMAKADATILAVMLAGIVAKGERDKLMQKLHNQFPVYSWRTNVGYGTQKHFQAIRVYGFTRYHRTRFVTTALKKKGKMS